MLRLSRWETTGMPSIWPWQEKQLTPVNWVQFNAQWNLLTTSLPREGTRGCTRQSMKSLVETADRLVRMIAAQP